MIHNFKAEGLNISGWSGEPSSSSRGLDPMGRANRVMRVRQLHDEVKSGGNQPADISRIHRRHKPLPSAFVFWVRKCWLQ